MIEAATERFEVKREIFRELDSLLAPDVILATNTSFHLDHQARCPDVTPGPRDWHALLQPRAVMKLVEVIRGLQTSDETFAQVRALSERVGKTPVEVNDGGRVCLQPRADAAVE